MKLIIIFRKKWFVKIKEKERSYFMVFDIESFYPSITKSLFANATQSAKQITEISDFEVALINKKRYCLMRRQHGGFLMGERGAGGV